MIFSYHEKIVHIDKRCDWYKKTTFHPSHSKDKDVTDISENKTTLRLSHNLWKGKGTAINPILFLVLTIKNK